MPASSVKEINVGDNLVPAMLSGRVDATLGAYWNYEAIQLAQLRKHPNVIRMDHVGVPTYDELVLVVRKSTIANQPDVIRRFVQALARGYEAARRQPAGRPSTTWCTRTPGSTRSSSSPACGRRCPSFFPSSPSSRGAGRTRRSGTPTAQWMLKQPPDLQPDAVPDASTNELLAGQGL